MFKVGKVYLRKDGKKIKIMGVSNFGTSYHCVKGSDHIWRYARPSDAGRCTGSPFDMIYPYNLIVGSEQADTSDVFAPMINYRFYINRFKDYMWKRTGHTYFLS
jgi:hypothetical protein